MGKVGFSLGMAVKALYVQGTSNVFLTDYNFYKRDNGERGREKRVRVRETGERGGGKDDGERER